MPTDLHTDLESLVASIPDGASLALPPDYSYTPAAACRALAARGPHDLHLIGVPTLHLMGDILIGAGCVASIECAAGTLGEFGMAPRFAAAVKSGRIHIKDATCPAIHAGLQAAEKGVPFMPLRGLIGSDLVTYRDDWKIIDNPFAPGDRIVALPAIQPDVALFHAPLADREGNVYLGVRRELVTLAHAAKASFVTYEELYDGDLLADPLYAAGTLSALYVSGLAEAKRGAWPMAMPGLYPRDDAHLRLYAELAATEDGFKEYVETHIFGRGAAA